MAMTKAEKSEMDALRTKLALRWSGVAEPERLPVPERGYVNGWLFNAHDTGRVLKAWTEAHRHGRDEHRSDDSTAYGRSASQNSSRLYASKRDALIALRLEQERRCAALLFRTDEMIASEASP
jgi:hypothetical protein